MRLLVAYDKNGKMYDGFPLSIGGSCSTTPTIFVLPTPSLSTVTPVLCVVDSFGFLSAWQLRTIGGGPAARLETPWGSFRGNTLHSGSDTTSLPSSPPSAEFFPASRAYNWPNPVYDGKTFIRYFVSQDASVRVRIFDLAGELVDELTGPGVGGLDNEVEWNASRVQSGVYFGRIEAQASGKQAVAIIKIAVVK